MAKPKTTQELTKGCKFERVLTWEVTEVPDHKDDWVEFTSKDLGIEIWLQYHNGIILYSVESDLINRGSFTCKSLNDGIMKVEKELFNEFTELQNIANKYIKLYNS